MNNAKHTPQKSSAKLLGLALGLAIVLLLALNWSQWSRTIRYQLTGAVKVDGLSVCMNPNDRFITPIMVRSGTWEPTETAALRRRLRPGDTFIDVGAYTGYYTAIASKLVGPDGHVIAFEPDPENFAILKRTVETNDLKNVTLEQRALSNVPGTIQLFHNEMSKGSHSIYEFDKSSGMVEVEAIPLDDYLKDWDHGVDIIKVDTEGAEGFILEGMHETLQRNRNVRVLMEFYPRKLRRSGYEAARLLDEIQSLGFDAFNIDEKRQSLFPITSQELLLRYPVDAPVWTNLLLQRSR